MSRDKVERLDLVYAVVGFDRDGSQWSEPVIFRVDNPQFAADFDFILPTKHAWRAYAPCHIAIPLESYNCRFRHGDGVWWFEEIVAGPFEAVGKTECQFESENRAQKDDRIARAREIVANLKPTAAGNSVDVRQAS